MNEIVGSVVMYFVTSNKNKLREFEEILGAKLESADIDLEEIQDISAHRIAEHKAREAYRRIGQSVIVEDTALHIEDWNGFPGALAKWVGDTIGYENIPEMLRANRRARAETVIGYCDKDGCRLFSGVVQGKIVETARGETGFGWDSIFVPDGHERTFAQMGAAGKNAVSMRRKALIGLKRFLGESNVVK